TTLFRSGRDQLVGGIDHHRLAAADARGAGEPDAATADQAGDVRPAVEHRGEVAGRVVDLHGEHRVALDRADLHDPDLALHRDLPAGDGADRGDAGRDTVACLPGRTVRRHDIRLAR